MQRIDDTDPRLVYTPPQDWHKDGVEAEFMHSTHWTQAVDAQMIFRFEGTKVTVYGTISGDLATSPTLNFFDVDNGEPVSWSASPQKQPVYNQLMFSSPTLEDGVHTLTMKATANFSHTYIDYLEFAPSRPSPSSFTLSTPSTPIPTTTVAVKVPNESIPASTVAGISVAATAVVMAGLACLLLWWKRRGYRRRRGDADSPVKPSEFRVIRESGSNTPKRTAK
ncbi:hypothetical protein PM082_022516 [Marasmius tenuissimus]|nr:hypothetical protein PM082_022516 [Marasmius tenuissimus]